MSRTTTDDCRENCPNHFNLAFYAARRAQEIMRRGDARVPEGEDRSVVVALREIARGVCEAPPLAAEIVKTNAAEETAEETADDTADETADAPAAASAADLAGE